MDEESKSKLITMNKTFQAMNWLQISSLDWKQLPSPQFPLFLLTGRLIRFRLKQTSPRDSSIVREHVIQWKRQNHFPFFPLQKKKTTLHCTVFAGYLNNILFIFLGSLEIAGDYNHNQVSSSLWSFFLLLPRNIRFS